MLFIYNQKDHSTKYNVISNIFNLVSIVDTIKHFLINDTNLLLMNRYIRIKANLTKTITVIEKTVFLTFKSILQLRITYTREADYSYHTTNYLNRNTSIAFLSRLSISIKMKKLSRTFLSTRIYCY